MCRLKLKYRIIGKKNQEFYRFILASKNIRQKGKVLENLGTWDTRKNYDPRSVSFNVYGFMSFYIFGATPNKSTLSQLFYFFVGLAKVYFSEAKMRLFLAIQLVKENILIKK